MTKRSRRPIDYPAMLKDPAVSYWLRAAIHDFIDRYVAISRRDPVDAVNDLELLIMLIQDKRDQILDSERRRNGGSRP